MNFQKSILRRIIKYILVLGVPLSVLDGVILWQAADEGKFWGTDAWLWIVVVGLVGVLVAGVVAGSIEHALILRATKRHLGGPARQ
jgi:hypothetical protein